MYGPGGDRGNGKHCRSGDGYRCGRSRRSILDVGVCLCRDGGSLWRDVSWNQIQIQRDGRTVYLRSFCISGAGLKKPRYRAALCVLLCPSVIGDGEHGSGQFDFRQLYLCIFPAAPDYRACGNGSHDGGGFRRNRKNIGGCQQAGTVFGLPLHVFMRYCDFQLL